MSVLVLACLLLLSGAHASSDQCTAQPVVRPPTQTPAERLRGVRAVWQQRRPLNATSMESLRAQAWAMFDHGFSSYMKHAFPKDNLLPVSCTGQNWQGGLGLTLVDSLDMLLLLNRRSDIQQALVQLKNLLTFDKDVKVHVFETTIRVLGGLLSGHVLLAEDPALAPGYDGLLLQLAEDLGNRLLKAFDTPSGLPGGHVHLQKGMLSGENISCTACAGTLLLEFGLLSRLTGNASYMAAAHHAAQVLFEQRSSLGLVGSGFHVWSRTWSHRDSTIGPGSDSYYEYLLKAYLMFGDRLYLDMFTELYVATMKHMQVPGQLGASSSAFLLDVHMDSGRLLKPWVSSLGAFWPAMQVLAGQHDAAVRLHSNFTAAWATWGWLPELFGADLSAVHPEDPGYNLRPEHIESTWYLKAVTGDPGGYYGGLAGAMMAVLNHSRVACGYAPITNVNTGAHTDLMESYFLSETVKYLYLSFVDSGPLLDYYLLSTEGHIMPAFPHPSDSHIEADLQQQDVATDAPTKQSQEEPADEQAGIITDAAASEQDSNTDDSCEGDGSATCAADVVPAAHTSANASTGINTTVVESSAAATPGMSIATPAAPAPARVNTSSLVGRPLASLPANCRSVCEIRAAEEESKYERRLHAALPLLPVRRAYSRRIRYRRCVACIHTTEALDANPPDSLAVRLARLNFGQEPGSKKRVKEQQPEALVHRVAGSSVLAQVLCVLKVYSPRNVACHKIRRLTALDNAVGLAPGTLLLQLTAIGPEQVLPASTLLVGLETDDQGPAVLPFPAAEASFGPRLPQLPEQCLTELLQPRQRLSLLQARCDINPWDDAPAYARKARRSADSAKMRQQLQEAAWVQKGRDSAWLVWARLQDPWVGLCPTAALCRQLVQYLSSNQSVEAMYAQQLQAEKDDMCMAVHQLPQQQVVSSRQHQHQGKQMQAAPEAVAVTALEIEAAETAEVCVAAWEHHKPPQLLTAADLSSTSLRAACIGWDPHSEAGGTWLPAAEWGAAEGGCAALPPASHTPRMGPLVLADPLNACTSLRNYDLLRGAIAVVARGDCSFIDKAMNVDRVGALGMVVLNMAPGGELVTMSGDDTGRSPDIPSVLLGSKDSKQLLWWLEHRQLLGSMVALQEGVMQPQEQLAKAAAEQQDTGKQKTKDQKQPAKGAEKEKSKQKNQKMQVGVLQTRVDLFVPARSQSWLTENVVSKGGDTQALFAEVVRDPRVISALQEAAYKP